MTNDKGRMDRWQGANVQVLAHFLRWKLGLSQAQTQTTLAERDCLARHATGRLRLAEIGVWHGVTTCRLRQAMAPNGVLLAVDPYPVGRLGLSFQQLIAHWEVSRIVNGQVRWLRKTGVEASRDPAVAELGGVDFLFLDGDHTYEGLRADWAAWSPLILPGGIVALHDSASSRTRQIDDAGSAIYTREVINRDRRFQTIEVVDTLTVLRRHEEAS